MDIICYGDESGHPFLQAIETGNTDEEQIRAHGAEKERGTEVWQDPSSSSEGQVPCDTGRCHKQLQGT